MLRVINRSNLQNRSGKHSMKLIGPLVLLSTFSASNSLAVATATATGGAGVHVPVGKDGDGEYTASTKGWYVIL